VVIDSASSELRRQLGPMAWTVLEEMLLGSADTAGECIARVSVRRLASSLGIAKDTAARAVRRLRAAGLLAVSQPRTDRGAFDAGNYVIKIPDCITFIASSTPIAMSSPVATSSPVASPPTRARVGRRDSSQLSLAIES
jgi:hypothetical protein